MNLNPALVGKLADAAIPVVGGLYLTLLGYRVVGKKAGESAKYDQSYARYGKVFKVLGPLLVVFTIGRLAAEQALASPAAAESKAAMTQKLANLQPGEEREISDGVFIKFHRAQATDPIAGGWQRAQSTAGGFVVEVPLPFNDFQTRAKTTDGVEFRAHSVGGKSAGLLSWAATCNTRRDGKLGPDGHQPAPEKTVTLGSPPRAYQRTIEFADLGCILIVEAQGSDPLPSAADRQRFLGSFKRTGKPTW